MPRARSAIEIPSFSTDVESKEFFIILSSQLKKDH